MHQASVTSKKKNTFTSLTYEFSLFGLAIPIEANDVAQCQIWKKTRQPYLPSQKGLHHQVTLFCEIIMGSIHMQPYKTHLTTCKPKVCCPTPQISCSHATCMVHDSFFWKAYMLFPDSTFIGYMETCSISFQSNTL